MTVLEALKQAVNILNGLNISVSQVHSIGLPISQAVGLIQASVNALEQNREPEAEEEEKQDEETADN